VRKQRLEEAEWRAIFDEADLVIPREHVGRLVGRAVERIRAFPGALDGAYAWSGGKDSQALRFVCELAGVRECVLSVTDLEYPAFLEWVTPNMPDRLEVLNSHLDLEWLARNPQMLFPTTATIAGRWFALNQQASQRVYARRRGVRVILLGRRREDGNFVGGPGDDHYESGGVTWFSPLAGWSHHEVLALIKHRGLPLPPFYGWPRGLRCGTHAWPARQWCRGEGHGWEEVHSIDPTVVEAAARLLSGARRFLDVRAVRVPR